VVQLGMIGYWLQTQPKSSKGGNGVAPTAPHPVPAGADPTLCPFLTNSAPQGDNDDNENSEEYEDVEISDTGVVTVVPKSTNTNKPSAESTTSSSFIAGASGNAPDDQADAIAAAVAAAEAAIDAFASQISNGSSKSNGRGVMHSHDE
jgi:hypothetical protein